MQVTKWYEQDQALMLLERDDASNLLNSKVEVKLMYEHVK